MLFLIAGASGSGKSACLPGLRQQTSGIDWHDFDHGPQLATTTAERQQLTEYWITVALQNQQCGLHTGIAGTAVLGELLACPSAPQLDGLHALLLDCADVVRIDRIRAREGYNSTSASQDMLSWAAWLRMHWSDPQWRPDVMEAAGAPGMHWARWSSWVRGDPRWHAETLDNTHLSIADTTRALVAWLHTHLPTSPAL